MRTGNIKVDGITTRRAMPILRKICWGMMCIFLACSCEKSKNAPDILTGPDGLAGRAGPIPSKDGSPFVSIGLYDSPHSKDQRLLIEFFASNGVGCFIEGKVMYEVKVHRDEVERVRFLLLTNPPPDPGFRSVWSRR